MAISHNQISSQGLHTQPKLKSLNFFVSFSSIRTAYLDQVSEKERAKENEKKIQIQTEAKNFH